MFAIIYPICAIPLVTVLFIVQRRSKKAGSLESYKSSLELLGGRKMAAELFWHLDIVGMILMIAMLACILVPFTLAGGVTAQWKTAKIIAPLVIGILLIPVWVYWERTCKHPMVPFKVTVSASRLGIWLTCCPASSRPCCLGCACNSYLAQHWYVISSRSHTPSLTCISLVPSGRFPLHCSVRQL